MDSKPVILFFIGLLVLQSFLIGYSVGIARHTETIFELELQVATETARNNLLTGLVID